MIAKEIPFFENRVEFTTIEPKRPAPIWVDYNGKFTITQCTFIKCKSRINEGNVFTSKKNVNVVFEACTFLNCGDNIDQFPQSLVWFSQPKASSL